MKSYVLTVEGSNVSYLIEAPNVKEAITNFEKSWFILTFSNGFSIKELTKLSV